MLLSRQRDRQPDIDEISSSLTVSRRRISRNAVTPLPTNDLPERFGRTGPAADRSERGWCCNEQERIANSRGKILIFINICDGQGGRQSSKWLLQPILMYCGSCVPSREQTSVRLVYRVSWSHGGEDSVPTTVLRHERDDDRRRAWRVAGISRGLPPPPSNLAVAVQLQELSLARR